MSSATAIRSCRIGNLAGPSLSSPTPPTASAAAMAAPVETCSTANNRYVTVDAITFAYRLLGPSSGVPLIMMMHYRGTMDHWDPALVDALAARRPVLLVDNAGIGRSSGEIPKTMAGWAAHYMAVVGALGFRQVDVLGFSMGGAAAQMFALNSPAGLTRRLILCGTMPSAGEGVVQADLGPFNALKGAESDADHRAAFLGTFFAASQSSQAAGRAAWDRITRSRTQMCSHVAAAGARRQGIAFANFMDPRQASAASYQRFHQLKMPVLIANGSQDLLLPTENSILMWNLLKDRDAQLHLYPDSGHGFLYQYATQFGALVNDFLDRAPLKAASRL